MLGTAAYMSPEQARGRAVDTRTDIWAFGCVLYETLTAKQAFHGETLPDIFAAIVRSDPDWTLRLSRRRYRAGDRPRVSSNTGARATARRTACPLNLRI